MTDSPKPSNRRRIGFIAIAASLVAVVGSALALAHEGGWRHGHMSGERAVEMGLEHVQAVLTKIGASDAQKSQIEGLLKPALDEIKTTRDAHMDSFRQFHELLSAPAIDRGKLEALRAENVHAIDVASKDFVTALTDALEVLTPEQRVALKAEMERRHGG